jgi:hypothetical protein
MELEEFERESTLEIVLVLPQAVSRGRLQNNTSTSTAVLCIQHDFSLFSHFPHGFFRVLLATQQY